MRIFLGISEIMLRRKKMKVIFGKNLFKWSKVDKAKRTRMSSGNIIKIKRPGILWFSKSNILQLLWTFGLQYFLLQSRSMITSCDVMESLHACWKNIRKILEHKYEV
jgi:hypothetical protein